MNVMRRKVLKNILGVGVMSAVPGILLAEDYSLSNNQEQKKYIYNPFEANLKSQQANIITNDILPIDSPAHEDFWKSPRSIFLKVNKTGEQSKIVYFNNGKLNEDGYKLSCYLLRDLHQEKMANIDLRLLDLICAVQSWLRYYGFNGPILVNSGFRTIKTNSGLEGVAKNSMHLYGKALDFTVPGLEPQALAKIAYQFKAGGIGIYPKQNFIHLDTGGVRYWTKN